MLFNYFVTQIGLIGILLLNDFCSKMNAASGSSGSIKVNYVHLLEFNFKFERFLNFQAKLGSFFPDKLKSRISFQLICLTNIKLFNYYFTLLDGLNDKKNRKKLDFTHHYKTFTVDATLNVAPFKIYNYFMNQISNSIFFSADGAITHKKKFEDKKIKIAKDLDEKKN
ncbi:hypothetical protein BpHYR1_033921 [Brachionus plicatilis]|uniref:Uncharacterized protein n=1 Tax=Brachionus plicatilis TaxID=10195 RepID=A0A3M7QGD0_BRAPC|nr:hypothetical protein BpHYR1_033921 [Brachionus plicatilis]